jgi:hypothetical protein
MKTFQIVALATLAAAAFAHETDLDNLRQRKASHIAAPAELAVVLTRVGVLG